MSAGILERQSPFGPTLFGDEFYPLTHRHGRIALEESLACPAIIRSRLLPGLTSEGIAGAAFIDIETTGLAGEEHAFGFPVGIGTFDNLAFRVRQYFLAQPFNERAMLSAVSTTLDRCSNVITFNGTAFDLPRLAERFALAGVPSPLKGLPHVDLLVPARRLFSHVLESRRVAEIETQLLGMSRSKYVQASEREAYPRRRNVADLPPLFEHNSLDVRFLPAFLGYIGQQTRSGRLDSNQLLALGVWAEESLDHDAATGHYHQAMLLSQPHAADRLATLLVKQKRWEESISVWSKEALSPDLPRKVKALDQLSGIHERHLAAPAEALAHALEARDLILQSNMQRRFIRTLPGLEKRVDRLRKRLNAENKRRPG